MRTQLSIMAAVLVLLVGATIASGGWSAPSAPPRERVPAIAPVSTIAKRVEALRGLRYTALPRPVYVTGATAKREAAADAARPEAAAGLAAEGAVDTLLGLIPARTDLQALTAGLFDGAVAGYYDPRDGRLRIIRSALTSNRVLGETTIAHELTHALDDQAIGLKTDALDADGDAALAYTALVEGSATALMTDYMAKHFTIGDTLGSSLSSAVGPTGTEGLPPFITASLLFPYLDGQRFVAALRDRADGRWTLVDYAERTRPPASSEQVLHPRKWIDVELPDRIRAFGIAPVLGADAKRLAAGAFGEWQTRQLLTIGGADDPGRAARGWGGDRYELWRTGEGPCATPCVTRDTLVLRWSWDTRGDAREFAAALRQAIPDALDATRSGRGTWTARGGAVALAERRAGVQTLVLAPTAVLAQRVLRAARARD